MSTASGTTMRWRVESWDPSYGASTETDDAAALGRSSAQVALDVEMPTQRWRPVDPDPAGPSWAAVLFVDGVRRVDAMAWILEPAEESPGDSGGGDASTENIPSRNVPSANTVPRNAAPALCASYAAGVVCCEPDGARLLTAEVRRGLFSTSEAATDVVTRAGRYRRVHIAARGEPATDLSLAVQRELVDVEVAVAASARNALAERAVPDDLLVVDGPLRGRAHLPRAIGFIKSHRSEYLPAAQHRVVGALEPGQRTPVFGLGTSWQRYSWYLKLPGRPGAPWAGVVRVECSVELPLADVVTLADRSAPMLCRHASTEYKDARAPQNLYPIAGLERELRRRLGDQGLIYRAIRRASTG